MNDVERYELAEKIVSMYQESDGVFSEEIAAKYFGDIEDPSAEDQEIIFNIARDLINHDQESESDDSSDDEAKGYTQDYVEGDAGSGSYQAPHEVAESN